MSSSQQSQSNYSQQNHNNGIKYANIITTISLALFLLLWGIIWSDINCLKASVLNLQLDMTKIKTIHGIESGILPDDRLNRSLSGQARPFIPSDSASLP
jgi:hypothetical protein